MNMKGLVTRMCPKCGKRNKIILSLSFNNKYVSDAHRVVCRCKGVYIELTGNIITTKGFNVILDYVEDDDYPDLEVILDHDREETTDQYGKLLKGVL